MAVEVSRLGEDVQFLGKVGKDVPGEHFKEHLRDNRVKDLTFRDDSHQTGLCLSLVYQDGERTMIADRGANNYLTQSEVENHLREIEGSKIVYFSGYSLINTPGVILYLMEKLRGKAEIWLNPGAPNISENSLLERVIKDYVDTLILNLDEAKSLTRKDKMDDILSHLERMIPLSVTTLGKEGCIVRENGNSVFVPPHRIIDEVDTTGAGDAFSAGYMVGKLRGYNSVACAESGHKTAVEFLERKTPIH